MTTQLIYAGFWRRVAAYLVDTILAFVLMLPHTYVLQRLLRPELLDHKWLYNGIEYLLSDVLVMVLIVIFWVKRAATPGMMLMELRVVDANSFANLTWKQAITRLLIRMLLIVSILGIFVIAMLIWDPRKQALHDKICQTVVIDAMDDYEYQPCG